MPLLRPYGERNVHLGDSPGKVSQFQINFDFSNCPVATYIIKQNNGNAAIKHKNGQLTELAKHAKECPNCQVQEFIQKVEDKNNLQLKQIHVEVAILHKFEKWLRKNHPEQSLSQGIQILLDYYDFAYNQMRPELIKYKQKYGELK